MQTGGPWVDDPQQGGEPAVPSAAGRRVGRTVTCSPGEVTTRSDGSSSLGDAQILPAGEFVEH